jgi:AraC family transcriptional regulator
MASQTKIEIEAASSYYGMENTSYKVLGKRRIANLRLQKTAYAVNYKSPAHSHENARFVFVLRGKFTEEYECKRRECQSLTMIVRPPLEKHSENYHGKGIVCLSVDVEPQWLEPLRQYNVNLDRSADFRSRNLSALIVKLSDEFAASDAASSLAIDALLLEIAVEVSRQEKKFAATSKVPRWLGDARDFIHAKYISNLTISEIASAANIHPVHLSRMFRRYHGCTIAEYIRRLRVEAASLALAESNETLAEIAVASGFSDQSHFSNLFKRLMNVTPAEYREIKRAR